MPKDNIIVPALLSSRTASIIYGIGTIFTGAAYIFYAKQTTPLLPGFLPKTNLWAYLIGSAFILAGLAIIINKQITRLACTLLVILLFGVAVSIDLRGLLNLQDELKNIYFQNLIKDLGLIAGAMIIGNFERERKHRRRGRHRVKNDKEEAV